MADTIEAGKLDRRITIERATEERDDFNNPVLTWAPLATVWAAVAYPSTGGRERFIAQEVGAEKTIRFRIRYSPTVASLNPKDRITYNGRTFDISAVAEIGRRVGLEIVGVARGD